MIKFIAGRVGQATFVLLGASIVVFFILRILPGDPVALLFSDGESFSPAAEAAYRAELGLDRPLATQYLSFVGEIVRGDLGQSILRKMPVDRMIAQALPLTVELTLAGLVIALVIAVPVAVVGALRQNSLLDRAGSLVALAGVSMPNFWQGILLIMLLGVYYPILPISGVIDIGLEIAPITGLPTLDALLGRNWEALGSQLRHLVLPAITLGTTTSAQIVRILRSSLLDVKHQDFIDALRARGLSERRVTLHMLRNALPTTVVIVGMRVGLLLSGTIVIETVFAYPGIGSLLIRAINDRDFPVVQSVVIVFTALVIISNLLADIVHGMLDPRIKVKQGS